MSDLTHDPELTAGVDGTGDAPPDDKPGENDGTKSIAEAAPPAAQKVNLVDLPEFRQYQANENRRYESLRQDLQSVEKRVAAAELERDAYKAMLDELDVDPADREALHQNALRVAQQSQLQAELDGYRQRDEQRERDANWVRDWENKVARMGLDVTDTRLKTAFNEARDNPTDDGFYDETYILTAIADMKAGAMTPEPAADLEARRAAAQQERAASGELKTIDTTRATPIDPDVLEAIQKEYEDNYNDTTASPGEKMRRHIAIQTKARAMGVELEAPE